MTVINLNTLTVNKNKYKDQHAFRTALTFIIWEYLDKLKYYNKETI